MRGRLARTALALLTSALLIGPPAAQAGTQLFEGSWTVKAMGNERTTGASESSVYSAVGFPGGIQCNPYQPRCPFASTPTDGSGNFHPAGGTPSGKSPFCAPWASWQSAGTTLRPAKGGTALSAMFFRIPPLYRNPGFFTSGGQPGATACSAISTGATPGGKGLVQAGQPITGTWSVVTTGNPGKGGFSFAAAPENHKAGVRATSVIGERSGGTYTYPYQYTYATLRNDQGVFGPNKGPGSFNIQYYQGANTVASINVTAGKNKFGGTMRMLGALTSKICEYQFGGCWNGENDWRYDAVGASAYYTPNGAVSQGYQVTNFAYYIHSVAMLISTVTVEGARFPWTTGAVTVTATGRGPHKTVHYAQGYDNRNTTTPSGKGIVQLVTPVLTRWLEPCCNFETGGVGILRIEFVGAAGSDSDVDGVVDALDNCSNTANPAQDDTDGDHCGNLCDADYDQNGIAGWSDYGFFSQCFATTNELCQHVEPIGGGRPAGFSDFGAFLTTLFGETPGPSGTTAGTTACP